MNHCHPPLELPQFRAGAAPIAQAAAQTGAGYWRSLDELAQTAEFQQMVEREFPSQLAVWNDPLGRRNFLKLMAASLALAGVTGCTSDPDEKIVPYVRSPEQITQGKPLYFATAMTRSGYALGLLAESHMGRPIKLEGNPEHPISLGATDPFAQASILSLYDPDRSQTVTHRGSIATWDGFITMLTAEMETLRSRRGAGLRILTETVTSPTLVSQLQSLLVDLPEARWHQYEPVNLDNVRGGAQLAFGRDVNVMYHLDQAEVILSLDADFLFVMPASLRYARQFIDHRRVSAGEATMNRLYVVESTPTITGAMADHRLPLRPSNVEAVARAVLAGVSGDNAAEIPGIPAAWLAPLLEDLRSHRGTSLVLAGPGQPPVVHAIVHAINDALENAGRTVTYLVPVEGQSANQAESLQKLVADMRDSAVDTLVIVGGNPVYTAPAGLNFAEALEKVRLRIHLSEHEDETSFLSHWHIPAAHYLESWSDARAADGTASIIQPLIAPLYGGKTAHELLSVLSGQPGRSSYEIVQEHWRQELGEENFGQIWRRAVHDGVVANTEAAVADVSLDFVPPPPTGGSAGEIEIEFRPDPTIWDGRFANNGWLQELPKPLTKLTWDNAALLSAATAERLKIGNQDVIEVKVGGRTVRASVWIKPGQPDDCVSLTFGYGRTRAGRLGTGLGYNAYAIRPTGGAWFSAGQISKTGDRYPLATTQQHHSLESRDIVRVTTLDRLQQNPSHLIDSKHSVEHLPSLYPENPDTTGNAWGMTIDQTACIGCNACVVACQAENNIPIVGKEQIEIGREMHWLRIDRYYHGELSSPETYFQPMMCVHCEKAPCEVVCPVAATVHDSEGTNNMIYNRCVGTRYCSNNCPYKVRRFNYLQYTDMTTPSLKLLRNPEVTVRSRGVMEKCTYCIQRISAARIEAKKENRGIRDGEVVTACQQACPTRAIVFGNLNDPQAAVRALKQSPLSYGVLAELNTQPRTTHLARVVNPHPDLPSPTAVTNIKPDKAHQ